MVYQDPFLGEIQLSKIHEETNFGFGWDKETILYKDEQGNFYISKTLSDGAYGNSTFERIEKKIIDIIITHINNDSTR